jgi:hypothetical protein
LRWPGVADRGSRRSARRELAESARDDFRKLPALRKELSTAEQWLEKPSGAGPVTSIATESSAHVASAPTDSAASEP